MFLDAHEEASVLLETEYFTGRAFRFLRVIMREKRIWIANPSARTGTITCMRMLVSINRQAVLYASCENSAVRLIDTCNNRKTTRNKPLRLIISFFPIEEQKMLLII
jgi:hypothetical protein